MFRSPTAVSLAWSSLRKGFAVVALFSLVLNLLMLAGPLYMLQVYDRVLTTQNMDTLIALTVLLAGVFVVSGALDFLRTRILARLGARFELRVGAPILEAAMRRRVQGGASAGQNPVDDVNGLREFISGAAVTAIFDAPWIPIYLGLLYVLHPLLGALGLAGALFLTTLALINNARSHRSMSQASDARRRSDALFQTGERNAELIDAMGMKGDLARRWAVRQNEASRFKARAGDGISTFSVVSKTTRMALQSGVLGLGAGLAVLGEATAGAMIAATIILSRALAPIDQLIGQWRSCLAARGSYKLLNALAAEHGADPERLTLPKPQLSLDAQIRQAGPPNAQTATLSGVSLTLRAGDVAAVIGPSGSGKSTLAKMLTGVWTPQRGEVRLDGTDASKWNRGDLGRSVGYLPQEVELFDGTIRENIARFASEIDDGQVLRAALAADVHELVASLPNGYETRIGDGFHLSGGQRQRIALARALYGDPFLLVLDEPNSDLDATGETALRKAIQIAQARGAVVVVMTHRPSTLQAVNKVLVLNNGVQTVFGDKADVLRPSESRVVAGGKAAPAMAPATTPPAAHAIERASK